MRSFLLFLFISMCVSATAQHAEFSFEGKKFAKLGEVKEGEQVSHIFHFTNTGDVPLVIENYQVECSCTKAIYSKLPIAPDESSSIEITFDSKGKMGWQYRTVQLFANTKKQVTELELRLKVINE